MDIETLKKDMADLMDWKQARESQQFTSPLDIESQKIIRLGGGQSRSSFGGVVQVDSDQLKSHLLLTDLIGFGFGVHIENVTKIFTTSGGDKVATNNFMLYASLPLVEFTVNSGTDVCTFSTKSYGLKNGNQVALTSTGTLPSGLSGLSFYYIINCTNLTFQLSTTLGGSAVDITSTGIGSHYLST